MSNWPENPTLGFGNWLSGRPNVPGGPWSLSLNGTNQYMDAGAPSNLNFDGHTQAFWISAWDYPTASTGDGYIIAKALASGALTGWALNRSISDPQVATPHYQIYLISNFGGNNYIRVNTPTNTAPINAWTNIIVSIDGTGTAAGIKAWINGTAQSMITAVDALTASTANTGHALIGSSFGGNYFPGYITQVACGSGTLTNSDATAIYNSGIPKNTNSWGAATATSWWALQNNFNDSVDSNSGSGVNSPTFTTSFYP